MGEVVSGRRVVIDVAAPDMTAIVEAAVAAIRAEAQRIEREQEAARQIGRVTVTVTAAPSPALLALLASGEAFQAVRG